MHRRSIHSRFHSRLPSNGPRIRSRRYVGNVHTSSYMNMQSCGDATAFSRNRERNKETGASSGAGNRTVSTRFEKATRASFFFTPFAFRTFVVSPVRLKYFHLPAHTRKRVLGEGNKFRYRCPRGFIRPPFWWYSRSYRSARRNAHYLRLFRFINYHRGTAARKYIGS